jgi:WhiB family redox-sensing transcriptional regulator
VSTAFPDDSFPRGSAEYQCVEPERIDSPIKRIAERSPAWLDDAACRDIEIDIFFPGNGERAQPALEICGRCPVRAECLAEAMDDPTLDHGIRGGMTSAARKQARKARSATTQGLAEAG